MPYDYTKDLYPASHEGFACAHCGHPIKKGELHLDCPDCAAIFCETCVKDGTFANHNCEDYEYDDEEEDDE